MTLETKRIDCLDGLRGLAALWVLLGHSLQLTGWRLPLLSSPDLGVDLFIMLSGFLMMYHYKRREDKSPWEKPSTWAAFWLKRFFRIAPLYYVLLAVALFLGPWLYESRMVIDDFLGRNPQLPERYLDASLTNIIAHLTFLFGISPNYAFRTPLPDWSLGLEMQFYAAFPFLMLILRKFRCVAGTVMVALVAFIAAKLLAMFNLHFPMPAFLPLKLHVFLCGMLLAAGLFASTRQNIAYLLLAVLLAMLPVTGDTGVVKVGTRVLLVIGFFALVHHETIPGLAGRLLNRISTTMGNSVFHWLGELSFGVYLIHLMLLQPIAALVISQFGDTLSAPERFAVVVPIVIALAYPLAYLGFMAIEGPGQTLGRKVYGFASRQLRPA